MAYFALVEDPASIGEHENRISCAGFFAYFLWRDSCKGRLLSGKHMHQVETSRADEQDDSHVRQGKHESQAWN